MTPGYAAKLGFTPRLTNVGAQKINNLALNAYKITIVEFLIENKFEKGSFFEEIFLLVDINIEVILKISFLSFTNANIKFVESNTLISRFYNTIKVLSTNS